MSSNIFYIAFSSADRSDCLNLLKLKADDKEVLEFWARQGETVIGDLVTGWSVILTKDERLVDDPSLLKKLSTKRTIFAGATIEAGPYSYFAEYTKGNFMWSVKFDSEKSDHITLSGKAPDLLKLVRAELDSSEHDEYDKGFLTAPLLFERLTGYLYSEPNDPKVIGPSLRFLQRK